MQEARGLRRDPCARARASSHSGRFARVISIYGVSLRAANLVSVSMVGMVDMGDGGWDVEVVLAGCERAARVEGAGVVGVEGLRFEAMEGIVVHLVRGVEVRVIFTVHISVVYMSITMSKGIDDE